MVKQIELKYLVLADAVNKSDKQAFPGQVSVTRGQRQIGEVRRFANGRHRPIARIGKQKTYQADFPSCRPSQVAWLEDHVGRIVCLRDWTGLKLFGVYFELAAVGVRNTYDCDVSFSLAGVTFTEAK